MNKEHSLIKYEKHLFFLLTLVFLIPVVAVKYFPTIDGPAHLYNGNLLRHLFFYNHILVSSFFEMNSTILSNWLSHIWYALLGTMLPAWFVEKSLLIFYVIAMAYSFRFLIRTASKSKNKAAINTYLIFPFIYSFPFCMGFYNFCVGIPILFFCIAFWLKNRNSFQYRKFIMLLLLTTLLYYTHLLNFLIFGLIVGTFELQELMREKQIVKSLRKILIVFLGSLPGLMFTLFFVFSNRAYESSRFMSKKDLISGIVELKPIITLSYENERIYALIILIGLCLLLCQAMFFYFIYLRKNRVFPANTAWFISAIITLIGYFVLPDWMVSGGVISIRLALFFFLLIIIWIALQEIPSKLSIIPIIVIIITGIFFVKYHYTQTKKLSADVAEMMSAENFIEEGKTLLPLNYSDNWLHSNFSNYLGTERLIIVLDNYEANKPHFPLKWKAGQNPYDLIGSFGVQNPCIAIQKYEMKTGHKIDYISRWCYNPDKMDSCKIVTSKIIETQFYLIFTSTNKHFELFKRKAGSQ